jgi:iron uptake system component EfeO
MPALDPRLARPSSPLAAVGLVGLILVGCAGGSTTASPAGPPASGSPAGSGALADRVIRISLTDAGCPAVPTMIGAGPVRFEIVNDGASKVSELEITQGDRIVGEKENLVAGLSGAFSLDLAPGDYGVVCPNASTEQTTLVVTAANGGAPSAVPPSAGASAAPPSAGASSTAGLSAALQAATIGYATYVREQAATLVDATGAFAAAVEAGDLEKAKSLYAPARIPYERIEPVAESFGDLDPAIDIRVADVVDPTTWTGFHRIEKALWVDKTTDGMAPIARLLVKDVGTLKALIDTAEYQPAQLANGASELLDEVARSKVTGEEEAYSRIDLVDFAANVDGARAAFELLAPALRIVDPAMATTISGRFADVQAGLATYKAGSGYAAFDKLTTDDIKTLSALVGALAEPLSQVAAKVVGGS